jgi:DNA mismatch repair protein MutS2
VLDSASEALASIRGELKVAHDRLLSRMESLASDSQFSPYLQDNLVTQRDGRYVLPLRAEFKGRVKAIVHDQSSSGATVFVEPLTVVDLNNRYRELQLEEREEVRRVLKALSRQIGACADEIETTVGILAELDLTFARAKYAEDLDATEAALQPFRSRQGPPHPGSTVRLWKARHPLLDEATVVPIDVEFDAETYALVITGPNTGGKTVTLKTVGLLALMAQSGLHIPVQAGSQMSAFQAVYADIGDEQSIEQSLSTFSGHITNIIDILEQADRRSLVILDELGAGTDPQEGAALAQAILTRLLDRGITTLVATHYPELKAYAHTTTGVVNASVEFDLETLSPTYHLTLGLPGRSNALSIASRLGLPEDIVAAAREGISPTDLRAEDLLEEIHRQRDAAQEARTAAEDLRQEASAMQEELRERLDQIEGERREALEKARAEGESRVAALKDDLEALRRELARARQPLEALQSVEDKVADLEDTFGAPVERELPEIPAPRSAPRRSLQVGDRVRLRSLDTRGVISALGEEEAEVRVGNLRVRSRRADLELLGGPPKESQREREESSQASSKEAAPTSVVSRSSAPGMELDLRGKRVDEALEAVDRYLDSAYLSGLPYVRLIHGKGTGRLREAVRQELRGHPHVTTFESGLPNEGGDGVTVARLKKT